MEFVGEKWTDARFLAKIGSRRIRSLSLHNTSITDAALIEIAGRLQLDSVEITSDRIGSAGVAALASHCPLTSLLIQSAPYVEDACMDELGGCTSLRELYLRETAVTDAGIRSVAKLSNLWSLAIDGTVVTDAGVESIAARRISLICFGRTPVTGVGFQSWRSDQKFCLYCEDGLFDDDGLRTACQSFETLWNVLIPGTRVTDAGLRFLAGNNTNMLRVPRTPVTEVGINWCLDHLNVESLDIDPLQVPCDYTPEARRFRYVHIHE